jgi:hypothetical protein
MTSSRCGARHRVEQLLLHGQGGEHGRGDRLAHGAAALADLVDLEPGEVDEELADDRSILVRCDLQLERLRRVDGAVLQPVGGGEERRRQVLLRHDQRPGLAQPCAGSDADALGSAGQLRRAAQGARSAGPHPHGHRHGGLVDVPGEVDQDVVVDDGARAVHLEHHGDHAGLLALGDGAVDELGHDRVDQPLDLDDADAAGVAARLLGRRPGTGRGRAGEGRESAHDHGQRDQGGTEGW